LTDSNFYWDSFYSSNRSKVIKGPSNFARYTLELLPQYSRIIDFGAGNGRDAYYFAENGFKVDAIDASKSAIEAIRSLSHPRVICHHGSVLVIADLTDSRKRDFLRPLVFYSRFVLHALTEADSESLLNLLGASNGIFSYVFLEYRVVEDREYAKEFGTHFRRFLDHTTLVSTASCWRGYEIYSNSIGKGFSRYGVEDPVLGRLILRSVCD